MRAIGRKLYRINKRSQQKIAELNVVLQESFSGMKIVKAFGREGLEQSASTDVNDRLLDLALQGPPHRRDRRAADGGAGRVRPSWARSGTAATR